MPGHGILPYGFMIYDRYSAGTAKLFAGLVSCLDIRSTKPLPTRGFNAASSASAVSFA